MKNDIFDKHTGAVKLSHISTEEKRRYSRDTYGRDNEPQKLIDFCLNCTKKKCEGNCIELKNYKQVLLGKKKCRYCGTTLIEHAPKNLAVFCPTCNIIKPLEEIMEVK